MSGRGGPFGIGLNATVGNYLRRPKMIHKVIYEFSHRDGSLEEIRKSFLDSIVAMNLASQQKD